MKSEFKVIFNHFAFISLCRQNQATASAVHPLIAIAIFNCQCTQTSIYCRGRKKYFSCCSQLMIFSAKASKPPYLVETFYSIESRQWSRVPAACLSIVIVWHWRNDGRWLGGAAARGYTISVNYDWSEFGMKLCNHQFSFNGIFLRELKIIN